MIAFSSCVKDNFDEPPTNCNDFNFTATHTIKELKAMLTGDTLKLGDTVMIMGYVSSSDLHGNIYKELIIEDETGGIAIQIDQTDMHETYPLGLKVFVNCNGLYLGKSYEVVKLGGLFEEYGTIKFGRISDEDIVSEQIIRTCDKNLVTPTDVNLPVNDDLLYQFVKIDSVQFADNEIGDTYADWINQISVNHNIIDINGKTLIVRTSGYATFAKDSLPEGSGTIIGILGKYNDDYQLYLNSTDDINFDLERF